MIIGSFLGSYLAMIVWLGGMKYTQVSTASALNQTTNIFIFIFAAIFLKEKITKQKTIGIVLAIVGAVMVTFG
jgi:drug/metabolite transporter (DMT)-like permease